MKITIHKRQGGEKIPIAEFKSSTVSIGYSYLGVSEPNILLCIGDGKRREYALHEHTILIEDEK